MAIRKPRMTFSQRLAEAQKIARLLFHGHEAFEVYVDMHWDKNEHATKAMFATKLITLAIDMPLDENLDANAMTQMIVTIGDLALKHHLMTINGAISIAKRLSRWLVNSIVPYSSVTMTAWLRHANTVSITVSKLLARAKFAKSYNFLDKEAECKQIEALREM